MGKHHGEVGTRLYRIWCCIKRRTIYKGHEKWAKSYADFGVTMCDEWARSYLTFKEWALQNGYSDDLQIDRIDNTGDYEPSNCRFVTPHENMMNRRNSIWVTYEGEHIPLIDLCKKTGITYKTALQRYKRGLPINQVLSKTSLGKQQRICGG